MKLSHLKNNKEALLYIMSIAMVFAFSAWVSLLNNFVIEVANFNGEKIGILQSLREIPGFLAFSVVLVSILIHQQKLAYFSIILLGIGTAFTGFFPNVSGLYLTTIIMSLGFHYLETLNQSLSLQWLSKKQAPIILGKISAAKSLSALLALGIIYLSMRFYHASYESVYLFFGLSTLIIGLVAWWFFVHFEETVPQKKNLKLKKKYWLYYVLTFLAGARRQIFVVFAGFLLVEKFEVSIEDLVLLLIANSLLNMYIAPKVGRFIAKFGEKYSLKLEYFGLILVFSAYAFAKDLYLIFALYMLDHLLFSMGIALKTYFQKIADPADIASASAVSFTINHIAAVFLPFILGTVWLYNYQWVFLIGAGIALSSLLLSFLIPNKLTTSLMNKNSPHLKH
jgi:predicted MFS family arabinose efflux permease